jgi:predicted ATPase
LTVEAIRLENFMAFQDTDWVELKPITLLFGLNSHGKSAMIRALLLLKQSLNATSATGPLVLTSKTGTDQGSFQEMVHQNDLDAQITFGFRCRLRGSMEMDEAAARAKTWLESDGTTVSEKIEWIDLTVGYRQSNDRQKQTIDPTALRLEVALASGQRIWQRAPVLFALELVDLPNGNREWQLWTDLLGNEIESIPVQLINGKHGFWPEFLNQHQVKDHFAESDWNLAKSILRNAQDSVEAFLESIAYMGPLRPPPARVYALDPAMAQEWRERGWGAFVDLIEGQFSQPDLDKVGKWLERLQVGHMIDPKPSRDTKGADATIARVDLFEQSTKSFNIKDMGFGASQVLPLLAQCLAAKERNVNTGFPGTLTIVEQPELHLHPGGQGVIGDLFIDRATQGRRFLIETHSEHILLRMQRRIAETHLQAIAPKSANLESIYFDLPLNALELVFVVRHNGDSKISIIQVDQYGQVIDHLSEFESFFSYDYQDVKCLNDVTAKIMRIESHR